MRAWLKGLVVAGVVGGAGLTLLGLLARWWPALDLVNSGLLFVTASRSCLSVSRWRCAIGG